MPSLTSGGALAALEALAKPNQMMALPEEYRETPLVNGSVGAQKGGDWQREHESDVVVNVLLNQPYCPVACLRFM